ncbi:MAG: C40 family peptidase [Notoacmeibacter sp.]|nr:C40 family peptidase [Notoacmeibacter sp.]
MPVRERVLHAAARWLGTPYRHQGSQCRVGCDCLGLVRGIWADIYGVNPPEPGPYSPDWAEVSATDPLLEAAKTLCGAALAPQDARPGDMLVFRWRRGDTCKHLGILQPDSRFIHAYSGQGVVSSPLVPQWRNRIAAAFAFPET